ncbi:MAG: glycosyltransferase family 2 protein [Anaerolineales bacterium]
MTSVNPGNIRISVFLPVFEDDEIIGKLVNEIHSVMLSSGEPYEVIVVDDGSKDVSTKVARKARARVISHPYNIGNAAAIKTGIRYARSEVLLMMNGDGQLSPDDIGKVLGGLDRYDMVVGARQRGYGVPLYRAIGNEIYNRLATYVCSFKIEDLTSGFRALMVDIARSFLYLLPDSLSYPNNFILAVIQSGFSFSHVPTHLKVRKGSGQRKIKLLEDGSRFLLIILRIATFFSPLRIFVPAIILLFMTGFLCGLYKVLALGLQYGLTSVMLMTFAGLVFLVGLVFEQIAQIDSRGAMWRAPINH